MATPTPNTITVPSRTRRVAGGRTLPAIGSAPYTLAPDGIWTWFTNPRAICHRGSTYVGYMKANGVPGITKYNHDTGIAQHKALTTSAVEADDHDNAAIHFLQDGRIASMWSKHNDPAGMSYSIAPRENPVASGAVNFVNVGGMLAYCNPHWLSSTQRYYDHYRLDQGARYIMSSADFASWSAPRGFVREPTGRRPYLQACDNGVDRIDILFTTGHPNEGGSNNSLYHCYLQPSGPSAENFFKSDGTLIGTNGTAMPSTASLIFDGGTAAGQAWCWDITYGPDGKPWVLFARFPTPASDHRYMFARWTGSAWVVSEITQAGPPLYSVETYYTAGIGFDAHDPRKVFLSRWEGSNWEIQEWRTSDNGATWAKHRDITTSTPVGTVNGRPYSPRGHDGRAACIYWRGTYTTFNAYNTSIMAVSEAA